MATVNDSSVTSDSSSDIDLHMSFEISSFEEEHEEHQQDIVPYRFEPEATDLSESDGSSEDEVDDQHRLENTDWCNCGSCTPMPTALESKCCSEISQIVEKIESYSDDLTCITRHPGFQTVCLDVFVLETAYYQYRSQYGDIQNSMNERNRYTAYRQLARWCWGYLGKSVRVPLPSCAVTKIRETFSSEEYHGYQDPE
ncbi:P2X purinoceptor 7-like [Ostrea edulis]|uniref:P2X purinoceptor 7-like n=1 Tax=Ostrea edulis TaxID=37623 RepID=UPI0024AF881F|nr:P2X purinoceptor 7-like [Ostrea edulis]